MLVFLIITLAVGMLMPIQTAANARMRTTVGSAFVVTMLSFSVSSCLLLGVSMVLGITVLPSASQLAQAPWWSWLGGVMALVTITAVIYMFKALGQLQTAILPLLGQLFFSLVIDHFGLFGSMRLPISPIRIIAMLLVVAGALTVIVLPNLKHANQPKSSGSHTLLWQIAGILTGCMMASLGTIYGTLGSHLGSAVQASTVSFIIAVCVIAVLCTIGGSISNAKRVFGRSNPWWMWLGGVCGAIAVFGNAWMIPKIGAGAYFVAYLSGQMLLSLCVEKYGWMGAPRKPIATVHLTGIALMLVGIGLVRL